MPLKEFKAKLVPEVREMNVALGRRLFSTTFAGEIASLLKGRGIEFEDFRDYTSADDSARIDWRVSQRAQRLLVRQYKVEINYNIFFLVDTSETMCFSSTKQLKCEYTAELVCNLFYGLLQTGNSVGFALFNDCIYRIAKPAMGKGRFHILKSELSKPENYGGRKNLSWTIQQALSILDKQSLVIIVSDFIGDNTDWATLLGVLAHRHEVIGILIRDPRDIKLPKETGQIIFEDPHSKKTIYVDSRDYTKKYNEDTQRELSIIRTIFQRNHSGLFEITTDVEFFKPILKFFRGGGGTWR
jgi:uncharacterized protein (DUF58 family)